ncbi:recombinase [Capsulimonas corticalis]|uniref:Recombinase n=1 Tax=Capsulimonas corticalis TaxID=2219043 RepID=A0A402D679_9BACT|nr:recombinase family protein [Capsulimonas corticalis]BDI31509.1 recombinase [Capsulimonas corticalis]
MAYFIYNRKSQEDDARQVQSIGDQRKLNEELVERLGLDVVECLDEAMSAKRPGRPVFSEMLERIERGEASGIIAWHPDRLARNAVDAGRIIDLLDTGRLTDLKFHSYTFENTPEGKWMLQIVLSQSKYFVDKLSKDVGRGMRSKLEKGHFPHRAGPGYLNDRNDRTIAVDPERFPMLRRAIETLLTGAYSVPQVHSILNNDWGYRTRRTRKTGGGPLPLSKFYTFLSNRFITGQMVVKGEVWEGKHQPMVTVQEFEQLQRIIKGASIQPQRYEFDFTGVIRCGICGCQVTADQRVKHYPSTGNTRRYVYYHCTNSKGGCRKVSITEPEIERQIGDLLGRVELSEEFRQWCLRPAKTWFDQENGRDCASLDSLQKELMLAERRKSGLMSDRLFNPDIYTAEEFKSQKEMLDGEINQLKSSIRQAEQKLEEDRKTIENILDFAVNAPRCFATGDTKTRKQIAMQMGAKYLLTLGKLEIVPHPLLVPILTFKPLENGSDKYKSDGLRDVDPSWSTIRDAILTLVRNGEYSFPRLSPASCGSGLTEP